MLKVGRFSGSGSKQALARASKPLGMVDGISGRSSSSATARAICRQPHCSGVSLAHPYSWQTRSQLIISYRQCDLQTAPLLRRFLRTAMWKAGLVAAQRQLLPVQCADSHTAQAFHLHTPCKKQYQSGRSSSTGTASAMCRQPDCSGISLAHPM